MCRFRDRPRVGCRRIRRALDGLDVRPLAILAFPSLNHHSCGPNHLRAAWRLCLGLGFFPAAAVFAWRFSMDEPELYKKSSMKAVKIPYSLIFRKYGVRLAAISITWYAFVLCGPCF
jgi:hypothetical protein